jgi:hypothetical protein
MDVSGILPKLCCFLFLSNKKISLKKTICHTKLVLAMLVVLIIWFDCYEESYITYIAIYDIFSII